MRHRFLEGFLEPRRHQAPVNSIEWRRSRKDTRDGASLKCMRTVGDTKSEGGGSQNKDRKPLGTLDGSAHPQHACRLGRNRPVVTRDHLHLAFVSVQTPRRRIPPKQGAANEGPPPTRNGSPSVLCPSRPGGEGPGKSGCPGASTGRPHCLGAQWPASGSRARQALAPADGQAHCDPTA